MSSSLQSISGLFGLTHSEKNLGRWYFGGLASAGAAVCTHPLDLLKVHLQTQQKAQLGLWGMCKQVVRHEGLRGLYNGISASVLRQLTYSTTRFGIYETCKKTWSDANAGQSVPFHMKLLLAGSAGGMGGLCGTPPDMINVRMQNDMKVAKELRRNYKHALQGLYSVYRQEGVVRMFEGWQMASSRAVLMTIGQVAFYDQIKQMMIEYGGLPDAIQTHLYASTTAAGIATVLTQPLDVMKTRMMNAQVGEYTSIMHCARSVLSNGFFKGFYKGFVPAFVRLLPHTVITFLLFEQLRFIFGRQPPLKKSAIVDEEGVELVAEANKGAKSK